MCMHAYVYVCVREMFVGKHVQYVCVCADPCIYSKCVYVCMLNEFNEEESQAASLLHVISISLFGVCSQSL